MSGIRSANDYSDLYSLYSQSTESRYHATPPKLPQNVPPITSPSPFRRARTVIRRYPNEFADNVPNTLDTPEKREPAPFPISRVAAVSLPGSTTTTPSTPPKRFNLTDPGVSSPSPSSRSAKDLINQWESRSPYHGHALDSFAHSTRTPTLLQTPARPTDSSFDSSGIESKSLSPPPQKMLEKEKKRSPIRQSFRNILSVFGKKPKNSKSTSAGTSNLDGQIPFVEVQHPSSSTVEPSVLTSTTALRSGPLLYFHPSSSFSEYSWTSYTADLHPTYILFTADPSSSSSIHPQTHVISLSGCTDVRSVPLKDLDPSARASLPKRGQGAEGTGIVSKESSDGPNVFQLVFEGGVEHRFAARTVKDRAWWVSGIWDVIITAQERSIHTRAKAEVVNHLQIDTLAANSTSQQASANSGPGSRLINPYSAALPREPSSSTPASIRLQDEAQTGPPPPTPPKGQLPPQEFSRTDSRLSPCSAITPPTSRPSYLRNDTLSPENNSSVSSRSPSILDLNHRSVVRQRLAAMQRGIQPTAPKPGDGHGRSRQNSQETGYSDVGMNSRPNTSSATPSSLKTPSESLSAKAQAPSRSSRFTAGTGSSSKTSTLNSRRQGSRERDSDAASLMYGGSLVHQSSHYDSQEIIDDYTDPPTTAAEGKGMHEDHPEGRYSTSRASSRLTTPAPSILEVDDDGDGNEHQSGYPSHHSSFAIPKSDSRSDVVLKNLSTNMSSSPLHFQTLASALDLLLTDSSQHTTSLSALQQMLSTSLTSQMTSLHAKTDGTSGKLLTQGAQTRGEVEEVKRGMDMLRGLLSDVCKGDEDDKKELKEIMQEVRTRLTELPVLLGMETEDPEKGVVTMGNLSPFKRSRSMKDKELPAEPGPVMQEIAEMSGKLDTVLEDLRGSSEGGGVLSREQTILTILEQEKEQRETQMAQQADSVRYLQELNTWLETFVNAGTAQIQAVAAGVHQLCSDLGHPMPLALPAPSEQYNPDNPDAEGQPAWQVDNQPPPFLQSLRDLLQQTKERQETEKNVMDGVGELIGTLREEMTRNKEMRDSFSLESVFAAMDRQKREQEGMLKGLAAELSNEIRGERLRFIEAMKDATAINVGVHVQEFKKELTREVMVMTQEVSRLQRERQAMEQQIADLFAFYARQKGQLPPGPPQRYLAPSHPPGGR